MNLGELIICELDYLIKVCVRIKINSGKDIALLAVPLIFVNSSTKPV